MLRLEAASGRHARSLQADVRKEDLEEWVVGSAFPDLHHPLALSIRAAGVTARAVVDERGECLALWGANPGGMAWMIATNEAVRRVQSMRRLFKVGIEEMHELYPRLQAWAYYRNVVHHLWMERCGFTRTGETALLGLGLPFIRFVRDRGTPCAWTR